MASEKKGALRGDELRVARGYWKSEAELDEVSDSMSPAEEGRWRRRCSSTFGSIKSRVRSSQPCLALNCASARRFCSLRAI